MHHKPLHIVSFDNPYPPQYGGTIEVYYKIKALHDLGYTIYLHCFAKSIPENFTELQSITEKVFFYKTVYNPFKLFSLLPFALLSRDNPQLLENITRLEAPILFEGLKTTLLISRGQLKNYKKILRQHNIEHDYMEGIASSEKNLLKKMIYWLESRKLKSYEKVISGFDHVLTLSHFEDVYVNEKFGNSAYVPVFHGNDKVAELTGFGKYAMYHGDLTLSDNKESARFIIELFKELDYPLIIASGSGEDFVKTLIGSSKNIKFIALRDFTHLKQLLNEAHINIIWSFQKSGTKLKLINALFHSRYCIINDNIIDDVNISQLCTIATTGEDVVEAVNRLKQSEYNDYHSRANVLEIHLNDKKNAVLIDKIINSK